MSNAATPARHHRKAPWNRKPPRKARHKSLTAAQKSRACRRAAQAGRPYPNLIDNMRVAHEGRRGH